MLPWVGHVCVLAPLSICLSVCLSVCLHSYTHLCSGMEEFDATYDSDEDADYSKMDMVRAVRMHFLSIQWNPSERTPLK